jgi:lincosamide nucleotidyltransferase A/C/D/E
VLWEETVEVLDALEVADVPHWVGGGWGVDVLFGEETRTHRDLDLAVDCDRLEACMATLARLGYVVETDWLPVRVEVAAPGQRWVDVHPVRFDATGLGIQGNPDGTHFTYPVGSLVEGRLHGRRVPILSAEQQERFHAARHGGDAGGAEWSTTRTAR